MVDVLGYFDSLSSFFLRLATGIIIFLVGFIIGKLLGSAIYRILHEIEINSFIKNSTGLKVNADHLISNIISYSIYFLSLVAALEQIGVSTIILYLLSGALLLILLLSFFLAIRDFLPNLLAGFYLYRRENLKKGAKVEIKGIKGTVVEMDLMQLKIESKKGDLIYLPNSVVANSEIKILK